MAEDSTRDDASASSAADQSAPGTSPARWVEFEVSRIVGDTLRPVEIAAAARAAGCLRPLYQYRALGASKGKARIVADYTLVPFIVEAFIDIAKHTHGPAAAAAGAAALAALEVIAP